MSDITCSYTHAWMMIKPNQLVENIFGIMLGQGIGHVDVHLHLSHTTSTTMFLQSSFIDLCEYKNLRKFMHLINFIIISICAHSVHEVYVNDLYPVFLKTIGHVGQRKFLW